MSSLWFDLRYAFRSLRRRKVVASLVICTLALGIGAVTGTFVVAHFVLLRPLPYADSDSLVMIWRKPKSRPSAMQGFRDEAELLRQISTASMVRNWRTHNSSLTDIAAIESWRGSLAAQADLLGAAGAERLRGVLATPNFFELLGVRSALGRSFMPGDSDAVMLSDGLWRRRFGGDPTIIGRTLQIAAGRERQPRSFTVVGVLPPDFRFTYPEETEIWMQLPWETLESANQLALQYQIVARLGRGVSVDQAQADIAGLYEREQQQEGTPPERLFTAWVERIHEYSLGRTRATVGLLAGICATVLLIGCFSAANLLIADTSRRRREIVTQRALGASRSRLVRQLMTETLLLASGAMAITVLMLVVLQPIVRSLVPLATPRADEIRFGLTAILILSLVGSAAVVLTGFVPVWLALRGNPRASSLGQHTFTTGYSSVRLRQVIIAAEVAFIVPLLIAAGLLLQTFANMLRVDLGFLDERIVVAEMRLLSPKYRDRGRLRDFETALLERMTGISGVENATITSAVPFRGVDFMRSVRQPAGPPILTNERQVEPNYFRIMEIPLLAGRLFSEVDRSDAAQEVVVSLELANLLFPDGNAIGQIVDSGPRRQIVGVVGNVRTRRVEDKGTPAYYVPRAQSPSTLVCLVVKVSNGTESVKAAIPGVVASIDREQPVQAINSLDQVVADSIDDRRVYATSSTALAAIALLLTGFGICGVLFQLVSERTRELGIRAALGAGPGQQLKTVLNQAMLPIGIGLAAGILGSVWMTQFIQGFLFGVTAVDPMTYVATAACVVCCGLAACYFPGRRAASLDPVAALRHE